MASGDGGDGVTSRRGDDFVPLLSCGSAVSMSELLVPACRPIYPTGNLAISRHVVAELAQQIAIAAMQVTDTQGLKVIVRGDIANLENLAAGVISKWLRTGIYVDGRPPTP